MWLFVFSVSYGSTVAVLPDPPDDPSVESAEVTWCAELPSCGPGRVDVVVASRLLQPGRTLTHADLQAACWPVGLVPIEACTSQQFAGRVPKERILDGELIRSERLAPRSRGPGLQALLPDDHRAVRISVVAVPPWLEPTQLVDLTDGKNTVSGAMVMAAHPSDLDGQVTVALPLEGVRRLDQLDPELPWMVVLRGLEPQPMTMVCP